MRIIQRKIVSALIFSKDGKILMGKKDPNKGGVYPDCWHIPGGGVDEGETLEQALIREVKEETKINISSYKIELIDDTSQGESEKILKDSNEKVLCKMNFNVYKITINDKLAEEINVELNDDLVKYQWFNPEDLDKTKITPPSIELFKRIGLIY